MTSATGFLRNFGSRFGTTHFAGLENSAFSFLLAASFAAPFSLPLSRVMLVLSFVCLTVHCVRTRRLPVFGWGTWLGLLFLLFMTLATVFGINPDRGIPKLRTFIWIAAIPLVATLMTSSQRMIRFLCAFSAGSIVLAVRVFYVVPVRAIAPYRAGDYPDFESAVVHAGSMTHGQLLMTGVVVSLSLLLLSIERKRARRGWLPAMLAQALALIINFKRGSWVCASLLLLSVAAVKRKWKLLLSLAVCLVAILAIPPVWDRARDTARDFRLRRGGRMAMWFKVAPTLIRENPLGIGHRSLTNEMMRDIAPAIEEDRDHLHSNILQIVLAAGWPGFAAFVAWIATSLAQGFRFVNRSRDGPPEQRTAAMVFLMILLGLLGNGMVEYNIGDSEIFLVYMFAIGGITAGVSRRLS